MSEKDLEELRDKALVPRRGVEDITETTEKAILKVIDNIDINSEGGKKILYGRLNNDQRRLFPLFYAMNRHLYDSKFLTSYLDNELYTTWGINGQGTGNMLKIALALIQKEREEQRSKKGVMGWLKSKIKGDKGQSGESYYNEG